MGEILCHIGEGKNTKYVVWWYEYSAKDDTVEPPHYLSQYFIARYWRKHEKQKQN